MEYIRIKDLEEHVGELCSVYGFVQTIRDQGKIKFVILRDASGLIQLVVLKSNTGAFEVVSSLSLESVVKVSGVVKEESQAPTGYEIEVGSIEVLSKADPQLPIPVVVEKGGQESDITLRLDWRWLDLRKEGRINIFRVWTAFEQGIRKFFEDNGFIQIYTPAFMSTPSESGAELFEVDYFDRKAYLAQSPQFYKQMAIASGFERVFMVGPVFRAEPSYTTRHMTEFTGWDFEIANIQSHHDVMECEERMLVAGFEKLAAVGFDVEVPTTPFPRLTMGDAKELLRKEGIASEKEHDLSPEEERKLSEIVKTLHNHDFVFVTDYHKSVRPFYHMRHADNPDLTKSFDLLYKGIEITTGAQREHRHDVLVNQAEEKGMSLTTLSDYLNYFKYGCPPHGGAGIGPGRIIMQILGLPSVKEATFLPRDVKRLKP